MLLLLAAYTLRISMRGASAPFLFPRGCLPRFLAASGQIPAFFMHRNGLSARSGEGSRGPEPAAASGTEAHRRQWRMKVGGVLGITRSIRRMRLCEFPGG